MAMLELDFQVLRNEIDRLAELCEALVRRHEDTKTALLEERDELLRRNEEAGLKIREMIERLRSLEQDG